MLRSAIIAGVVALSCLGIPRPAAAQMHGGHMGGGHMGGGHFDGHGHGHFGNHFFFGFGFPGYYGYGYGGYPYYPGYYYPPYYPAYYYPPYPYPPYPGYPPNPGYPGAAGPAGAAGTVTPHAAVSAVDPATVREVQAELQRRGYDVGSVDGRLGPRTKAAIREYERDAGLPLDGLPSATLRTHMQQHPTG
jgi:putative peptidoglycan binding protein